MRTSDFDFELPEKLIAQVPSPERTQSRLLVVQRGSRTLEHRTFTDIGSYLHPGDVVVLNDSRVVPARLRGTNVQTGGQFELLLVEQNGPNDWWALVRPGKRARVGTRIWMNDAQGRATLIEALVLETNEEGHRRVRFSGVPEILDALPVLGEVPLPPYIRRELGFDATLDRERYQTVFAKPPGSVAAPTAGLHFTTGLLEELKQKGIHVCFVTLHVGLGTFAPVKSEEVTAHRMHAERYSLSEETVGLIHNARKNGGKLLAVGTTTVRVLESVAARHEGRLVPGEGRTSIFIYPPYRFRVVDRLLTNFHLPRSTLLMLVSALAEPGGTAGRQTVLEAYRQAVKNEYRFFSYGDAMLLL